MAARATAPALRAAFQAPARPRLRPLAPTLVMVANAHATQLVRHPELVDGARRLLSATGATVDVHVTSTVDELGAVLSEAGRRVVLLGGDGSLFALMTGRRVRDTQNGMRLLRGAALEGFPPGRYEAETKHLTWVLQDGLAVPWVPMPAIYGEESSSFRSGRDSVRVLWALVARNGRPSPSRARSPTRRRCVRARANGDQGNDRSRSRKTGCRGASAANASSGSSRSASKKRFTTGVVRRYSRRTGAASSGASSSTPCRVVLSARVSSTSRAARAFFTHSRSPYGATSQRRSPSITSCTGVE